MKKYLGLFLILLILFFCAGYYLISKGTIKLPNSFIADSIGLSQNEIGVRVKKGYQLYSFIYPEKAKKSNVIYESSNPDIAEVNSVTGYIVGKKIGTATIVAKLANQELIQDSCIVYVSKNNILLDGINVNAKEINLSVGNTYQLKYQMSPSNANAHDIEFISSDNSIASVSDEGQISGINHGTAIITISDKITGIKEDVIANVYNEASNNTNNVAREIVVDENNITVNVGGKYEINAKVKPDEANQKLTYTSLNESIGSVNENGVIKGLSKGTTKIIVRAINGIEKIINLEVQEETIKLSKISLNKKSISIKEGSSERLKVTFSPTNATNKGLRWESDDSSIATVNSGNIVGVSVGSTIIRVISDDGEYEDTVNVTVTKANNAVYETDLILSSQSINIKANESKNISVTFVPNNVTNKNLNWRSDNPEIATVSNGLIVGKKAGTTKIYVTSNTKKIEKTINVTVSNVEVTSIELSDSNLTMTVGDTDTLIKTIKPSNATNKDVTWSSSDNNIVTVDRHGSIEAKNVGTATITVRTNNGKTAKCTIKVNKKTTTQEVIEVKSVTLSNTNASMYIGDEITLTATVSPSNANNKKITWSSSNTSVADVTSGKITAKAKGTAEIIAKTSNGVSAKCKITVNQKTIAVTGISLNKETASLYKGDKLILTATISPSNATNKNVTWTSSNNSVATVDKGNVTTVGVGETIITAKTSNGKTATCRITVSKKTVAVTGISLDKNTATIQEGNKVTLKATVSPSNATNKTVTWTSSNNSVATVTNGEVVGKSAGTATITAKTSNGKTATCKVTVNKKGVNLRVATFNIGMYKCGTNKTIRCETTPKDLANLIKSHNIDIIGIQEATPEKLTNRLASEFGYSNNNYFYREPNNANAIMSKYNFVSKNYNKLQSCRESREIDKAVVNINGVDISFYVTHFSYQDECHDVHFQSAVDIMKNDPNPIILTGDFNIWDRSFHDKYFKPLGFIVAGYDNNYNGTGQVTYMDSIYVLPKGHISTNGFKSINTVGTYTDHDLVYADLIIY